MRAASQSPLSESSHSVLLSRRSLFHGTEPTIVAVAGVSAHARLDPSIWSPSSFAASESLAPASLSPIMQHSDPNILRSQLDFKPVLSNGFKPKSHQRGVRNGVLGIELAPVAVGEDEAEEDSFEYAHDGLSSARHAELLAQHGPNALPDTKIPRWYTFCQQLWQPMPLMIWLAIVIEASILNFLDAGILLFIQTTNASIGYAGISLLLYSCLFF